MQKSHIVVVNSQQLVFDLALGVQVEGWEVAW